MQISGSERSSDLRVVDYRIEPVGDDGFRLWVRREFSSAAVVTFVVLAVFVGIGLWFSAMFLGAGWHPLRESFGPARHGAATKPSGFPVCCVPFLLVFMALWLRPVILGIKTQIDRLRGRERWLFDHTGVVPPPDSTGGQMMPLLASEQPVRAGVCPIGGGWAVAISAPIRDRVSGPLLIGPFASEDHARRLEHDLRARRAEWFAEADGSPVVFGLPKLTPTDPTAAPATVEQFEFLQDEPGRLRLVLRRHRRGYRLNGTLFLTVWLCGWAVGEGLVGYLLMLRALAGLGLQGAHIPTVATQPGRAHEAPLAFLIIWFTFWTFGGFMAIRQLVLRFRRREIWSFENDRIVAGPSWLFTSRRELRTDGEVHVRLTQEPVGPGLEFVSGGVSLHLGPFESEEVVIRVARVIAMARRWWKWPENLGRGA